VRGIGEVPEAAESLGINVKKYRFYVLVFAGMLCALGGAQLSLGSVNLFVENMSAGRGWIAVVAVMLGQSHPYGVFGAATLFGFVDSLSFRIQGVGLPQQFTEMLPYVITLLTLFLIELERRRRKRARAGR
jgi:simple sugar transport system permease protein